MSMTNAQIDDLKNYLVRELGKVAENIARARTDEVLHRLLQDRASDILDQTRSEIKRLIREHVEEHVVVTVKLEEQ